jgi:hypothetical protein
MFARLWHGRASWCLTVLGTLGLMVSPAWCQTPSTLDTMRIVVAAALPGDTVAVDLYLRNVDTLGGYTVRLRYDPSLIEPLTDTTIIRTDTSISVAAQQLRGTPFESFGGIVRSPGEMVLAAFDLSPASQPLGTYFLPGRGVAARFRWRVLPSATPQVTSIYFENDSVFPQSFNTMADISGLIFKRPVLIPGSLTILTCGCPYEGDVNNNGISYELGDVVSLISYTFENAPAPLKDASCRHRNRGEITCDGVVDVMDVVRMMNILAGRSVPTCDPCACSPYPSGCQ